jgi:LPXTG-site transpeptidase (sortase) family protein
MEILTKPFKPARRAWVWAERALLLIGLLCLGIYTWSWLDTWLYDRAQSAKLEQALAAQAEIRTPATESDSFESMRKGVERERKKEHQAPAALESGELIGRIAVDRLGVSAIVLEGVGMRELRRGAGHIPATPLPQQEEGNVGIAAHRDSFFRALKDIRENDTIEMTTLDGTFHYKVEWTKIVKPEDVSVLEPTDEPALTLVTCYPFYYVGSAPKRFIVRAGRIPAPEEPAEWIVDVGTE